MKPTHKLEACTSHKPLRNITAWQQQESILLDLRYKVKVLLKHWATTTNTTINFAEGSSVSNSNDIYYVPFTKHLQICKYPVRITHCYLYLKPFNTSVFYCKPSRKCSFLHSNQVFWFVNSLSRHLTQLESLHLLAIYLEWLHDQIWQ